MFDFPEHIQGSKSMATHAAVMEIRQQKRSKVQSLGKGYEKMMPQSQGLFNAILNHIYFD